VSADIDIHHLSAAYALDALDERERMAFEAHYPSCEVCRSDVADFRATLAHLAAATATPAPTAMKDRVLAEIAQTRQLSPLLPSKVTELAERRRRRQRTIGGFLAAAAAVVALVGGVLAFRGGDDQPAYASALTEVLAQADGRVVTLAADPAGGATGTVKVAWSASDDRAVLLGDGLPAAPDGQAYELWLIGADGPVPMQVLQGAADGELRAVVPIDAEPQAWGVTIEPEGGSPAPTGPILFSATA
jgi:anti-sigma-K factor RskA